MKKLLIGTLAVILLASPFAVLRADATTSSATTSTSSKSWRGSEMRDKVKERFENTKEKIEDRRETMRARFDTRRAEVITKILNRLEERFQKTIDRMENVTVRVQERIDIVNDSGTTTVAAQLNLDAAKDILEDAQDALDDIDLDTAIATTSTSTVATSTTPGAVLKGIRDEFQAVRALLKSAHEKIADAINSLKPGSSDSEDDDNN